MDTFSLQEHLRDLQHGPRVLPLQNQGGHRLPPPHLDDGTELRGAASPILPPASSCLNPALGSTKPLCRKFEPRFLGDG